MDIVIIDNFDSFTFNLKHYVSEFVDKCDVLRHDKVDLVDIQKYDKIILSPGPSLPSNYPINFSILEEYSNTKPILGVCLGMQTICEYFGAELENIQFVKHGVTSINKIVEEDILFYNIPNAFNVAHYHSWVVKKQNFPNSLLVTSENEDGLIMSVSHKKLNIKGVQFHPESVLTRHGKKIIENWCVS